MSDAEKCVFNKIVRFNKFILKIKTKNKLRSNNFFYYAQNITKLYIKKDKRKINDGGV